MQNRLKSPVLWAGIASIFFILAGNYGLYNLIHIPEGSIRTIVDILFGIFGMGAVANNPTNLKGF